jgi:hypothetical protein
LGEWKVIDAELDVSTKLDATEVASVELIDGVKLARGSVLRAQWQRVDVGGQHGAL